MIKLANILTKLADNQQSNSLATRLREKRFFLLKSFIKNNYGVNLTRSLKIIDVGGTPTIWEKNLSFLKNLEITVVNIKKFQTSCQNLKCVVADAKSMKQFKDKEFDIAFSNSMIEHVGTYKNQVVVANEIMRISQRYFVQTPNYYFPVEPHFIFPFFQFLPLNIKVWLVTNFKLGWRKKAADKSKAIKLVNSINLLRKNQLMELFPGATLFEEKILGLTKSFIVYGESEPPHYGSSKEIARAPESQTHT